MPQQRNAYKQLTAMKYLSLFFILLCGSVHAEEKPIILDWDELLGENNLRAAVKKAHPTLETCFYHFNGHNIFGAFREPRKNRIFI